MRAVLILTFVASGCASTSYTPYRLHPGELFLAQDEHLEIHDVTGEVAAEPGWAGLQERMGCVSEARRHAREARRQGRRAQALAIVGGILGVASLAALAGIAYVQSDPTKAGAIIGSGLGAGVVGVGLAAGSRRHRILANGHAVDAMNYHNDGILDGRGRCVTNAGP
jgi:hypothetical protein